MVACEATQSTPELDLDADTARLTRRPQQLLALSNHRGRTPHCGASALGLPRRGIVSFVARGSGCCARTPRRPLGRDQGEAPLRDCRLEKPDRDSCPVRPRVGSASNRRPLDAKAARVGRGQSRARLRSGVDLDLPDVLRRVSGDLPPVRVARGSGDHRGQLLRPGRGRQRVDAHSRGEGRRRRRSRATPRRDRAIRHRRREARCVPRHLVARWSDAGGAPSGEARCSAVSRLQRFPRATIPEQDRSGDHWTGLQLGCVQLLLGRDELGWPELSLAQRRERSRRARIPVAAPLHGPLRVHRPEAELRPGRLGSADIAHSRPRSRCGSQPRLSPAPARAGRRSGRR